MEEKNLVLIPGLNNTADIWAGVVKELQDDFNCYPITCPAISNIDQLAEVLLKELPESFYLCGFSFGGFVALSMLDQAPERIKGFAVMATAAAADTDARKEARLAAIRRAQNGEYEEMIGGQAGKIFYGSNGEKTEMKALRKKMLHEYGAERFIAHQQASADRIDHTATLRQFNGPVLAVAGSDDQVFTPSVMKELAETIGGAAYAEVPKTGHMLPMEEPQEVAKVLREWIASLQQESE